MALLHGDLGAKHDNGMRHLDLSEHAVAALYEDPTGHRGFGNRRVNHPAAERPVSGQDEWAGTTHYEHEIQNPAHSHHDSDAGQGARVLPLRNFARP